MQQQDAAPFEDDLFPDGPELGQRDFVIACFADVSIPGSRISTSSSQGRRGPTVIELSGGTAGLPKTSFAVCHQVTTLDRAKLTKRLGTLPSESLHEVEQGLKAAMDLD